MQPEKAIVIPQIIETASVINKLEYYAYQLIGVGTQIEQLKILCILLFGSFFLKNIYK